MKQFIVSLYVRSRAIDAEAIGRLLGVEPDGGHRRGARGDRPGGDRSYIDHLWWIDSGAGDDATMAAHAASLLARLPPISPEVADLAAAGDLEISISVGIMYDGYTTSVRLPRALVACAARLGATVEVSSYPTDFGEGPDA